MASLTRAKLSVKNKYYIDKHRYYELKHFCLQYNLWKQIYKELDGLSTILEDTNDPTYIIVKERLLYFDRMRMVEQAAIETDPDLYDYVLKAVTEGLSYTYLKSKLDIPCGKDMYYERYRRFFWILDRIRN